MGVGSSSDIVSVWTLGLWLRHQIFDERSHCGTVEKVFPAGTGVVVANPEGVMVIPPEDRKRLEELGEAYVRLQFNTIGFSSPFQISARKWLADLDEAHLVRNEALQAKQTQQSESPLKAAWIAAYAAIIAALVAIVAWIYPLH